MKSRRIRWAGHVAAECICDISCKARRKATRRPRHGWVDNIMMVRGEIGWDGMAQDRDTWKAFVNGVMNRRVP
jgi:hypothetical protein